MAGAAKKLHANELAGVGTYFMDLKYLVDHDLVGDYRDAGTPESDYITAEKGSGTHTVVLTPESSLDGMKKGSKLYFATAPGSTFEVRDLEQVDRIYNQPIHVGHDGDSKADWFLTIDPDEKVINPNGLVPETVYSNVLAVWRDNDTLLKRLGELRYVDENPGWWGRYINSRLKNDGEHAFKGTWQTVQLGWDKKKVVDDETLRYWGLGLDYKWSKPDYYVGSGKQHMYDLSLYMTQFKDDGRYLDLVGGLGRVHSKYTTVYGDKGSFRNWAASIGAEVGQKRHFNEHWTYEPQAQLTYSRVWGTDFTTGRGFRVSQDDADSLVGRLGIVFAREFDVDKENPRRIYAKASVLHDFLGKAESSVGQDVVFNGGGDFGGTWYVLGLGTNYNFNKNCQFYFDAERSFGGDVKMKYRFNAGLRYKF